MILVLHFAVVLIACSETTNSYSLNNHQRIRALIKRAEPRPDNECGPNKVYSDCTNCAATCSLAKKKYVEHYCNATESPCEQGCVCADGLFFKTPTNESECVSLEKCVTAAINPCSIDHEFVCDNAKCVPKEWVNDGMNDCGDYSDEYDSDEIDDWSDLDSESEEDEDGCKKESFRCLNSSSTILHGSTSDEEDYYEGSELDDLIHEVTTGCVDPSFVCDGESDCPDSSDELTETCAKVVCSDEALKCNESNTCLNNIGQLCNGEIDCAFGEDEDPNFCASFDCGVAFKCSNDRCIHKPYVCDGDNDCGDGSDEVGCHG